jgi:hypothetical protein
MFQVTMALIYLVMWLAAFFLCVLAGFRGWLYVSSLSILSLLTDVPCHNDRCKKIARHLRHPPKRTCISLARKVPVWMHIALCIVGFLSFTVLIWLMLIYGCVHPSPSNTWQASDIHTSVPSTMLLGCLRGSAATGSCCTLRLLRPSPFSSSFHLDDAGLGSLGNSEHFSHIFSCLPNVSHQYSNAFFLNHYLGLSSDTYLLLHRHSRSEPSNIDFLQLTSAKTFMKIGLKLSKSFGHYRGGPSGRPLPRRLLYMHPTSISPLSGLALYSFTQPKSLATSISPFICRLIAIWPPSPASVAALHLGPEQLRSNNSPAVARPPSRQHEPQSTAFFDSVPRSPAAACPR